MLPTLENGPSACDLLFKGASRTYCLLNNSCGAANSLHGTSRSPATALFRPPPEEESLFADTLSPFLGLKGPSAASPLPPTSQLPSSSPPADSSKPHPPPNSSSERLTVIVDNDDAEDPSGGFSPSTPTPASFGSLNLWSSLPLVQQLPQSPAPPPLARASTMSRLPSSSGTPKATHYPARWDGAWPSRAAASSASQQPGNQGLSEPLPRPGLRHTASRGRATLMHSRSRISLETGAALQDPNRPRAGSEAQQEVGAPAPRARTVSEHWFPSSPLPGRASASGNLLLPGRMSLGGGEGPRAGGAAAHAEAAGVLLAGDGQATAATAPAAPAGGGSGPPAAAAVGRKQLPQPPASPRAPTPHLGLRHCASLGRMLPALTMAPEQQQPEQQLAAGAAAAAATAAAVWQDRPSKGRAPEAIPSLPGAGAGPQAQQQHYLTLSDILNAPSVPPPFVPLHRPAADTLLHVWANAAPQMQRDTWSREDYLITRQLHRGYSSEVFQAVCRASGMQVVLKCYSLGRLSEFLTHQVMREVRVHSRLEHPNVVQLFGAFKEDKKLVLVLEFVGGGSLAAARLKLGARMREAQAVQLVLSPLLRALHYLHARRIVHRDIKPGNLLFTPDWRLKLCDFGVSICMEDERPVTRTGSRDYMAPEVLSCPLKNCSADNKQDDSLAYSTAVDVWSVGVLSYELLVGFAPFSGGLACQPPQQQQQQHRRLAFPASVSTTARSFVNACLQLRPEDRPSIQELLQHPWLKTLDRPLRSDPTSRERLAGAAGIRLW